MIEKTGTGVSNEKEKVKKSQSRKRDTPVRHPLRVPGRGCHKGIRMSSLKQGNTNVKPERPYPRCRR